MYTWVEYDFERPLLWAEEVVSQDRFYCTYNRSGNRQIDTHLWAAHQMRTTHNRGGNRQIDTHLWAAHHYVFYLQQGWQQTDQLPSLGSPSSESSQCCYRHRSMQSSVSQGSQSVPSKQRKKSRLKHLVIIKWKLH